MGLRSPLIVQVTLGSTVADLEIGRIPVSRRVGMADHQHPTSIVELIDEIVCGAPPAGEKNRMSPATAVNSRFRKSALNRIMRIPLFFCSTPNP